MDGYKKMVRWQILIKQAVEAMAMVLAFEQAYQVTKEPSYIELMFTSFMWFLG